MATITTDTFLDGGTARTAGEAWTCNGGRLRVRTDSRWHANAPASMTGSLGSVTVSATLGGGYTIDSSAVRWMPYNTGSGNVPAIGTTVTQGGVSGYLLGVWASITSAPTAVGAAMPATGFLKFREVTAGPFAAGALTGIGASATGPDVVGWLEVVHDQAATLSLPRLGSFEVNPDGVARWFALGVTTGAANQLVSVPTNGSTTGYVPGIWIATTATPLTDDDWEFYPSIYAAVMIAANLGTDARSKFVCMETNGQVRIGHNGTAAVGFVPPAGRAIRIPNVFGRQCTTAARATNVIPSATLTTRPDFVTTSAGSININGAALDWWLSFAQPYSVRLHHFATFDQVVVSELATALDIYDGGNGISQSLDVRTLQLTSCFAGGSVLKWYAPRYLAAASGPLVEFNYLSGAWDLDIQAGLVQYARTARVPFQFTSCSGLKGRLRQFNGQTTITTCSDCEIDNIDHVDRYVGGTNATTGVYAVQVTASSDGVKVRSVTFGLNGTIPNCHPYLGVFSSGQSQNITFRGLGSRSAFAPGGSANNPAYIFISAGNNRNVRVQRCYMTPTRTGAISTQNSDIDPVYENVYGDFADSLVIAALNSKVKNCGGTNTVTGQASVYGTHFSDAFTSDTVGRVVCAMNEPTAKTAPLVTTVAGTPKFTSAGGLVLAALNDEIVIEQDYFVLGCTGLAATAPVVTGTNVTYASGPDWGNHDIYYQIDTGSGWNGVWKDLTGANLSGETVSPSTGFKLKYRIVCDTASTTNLVSYIRVETTSTLAAQVANLYPLDTNTVTFTGLPAGTDVVVLQAGTSTVLAQQDAGAGTTYSFTYAGAQSIDVGFIKEGFVPLYIRGLSLTTADSSIPVAMTPDRNFI